jgi:hypothetical protein
VDRRRRLESSPTLGTTRQVGSRTHPPLTVGTLEGRSLAHRYPTLGPDRDKSYHSPGRSGPRACRRGTHLQTTCAA